MQLGFRIIFTLTLLITVGESAFSLGLTPENPDMQSAEEIETARQRIALEFSGAIHPSDLSAKQRHSILRKYGHLDPEGMIPENLLEEAVLFFDANRARFPNQTHLTIVDFALRSNLKRFFLVNLESGAVEGYRTTHGINSDVDDNGYAESFSNVPESWQSSLGFMRVAEVYSGAYGRSVRLDGLSPTNSNVRARAVVVHGWDHVKEADQIQGRSRGCITLDWQLKDAVIDRIHSGSLMYAGVSEAGRVAPLTRR